MEYDSNIGKQIQMCLKYVPKYVTFYHNFTYRQTRTSSYWKLGCAVRPTDERKHFSNYIEECQSKISICENCVSSSYCTFKVAFVTTFLEDRYESCAVITESPPKMIQIVLLISILM